MANWQTLRGVIIAETGEVKDMPIFPYVEYGEAIPLFEAGRCIAKDEENERYYWAAFNSISCRWVAYYRATLADVKSYGLKVLELNGGKIKSMKPLI